MVRRTGTMARPVSSKKSAKAQQPHGAGGNPRPSRGHDGVGQAGRVPSRGKRLLSNPIVPPHLDEDIDDDLAFNSDDEAMYGHLFRTSGAPERSSLPSRRPGTDQTRPTSSSARSTRGKKAPRRHDDNNEGKTEEADDDDDDALYNYHEDGQSSDGSDEDYIDLEDMLDMSEEASATANTRRHTATTTTTTTQRHASDTTHAAAVAEAPRGAHTRPPTHAPQRCTTPATTAAEESLHGEAVLGVDGLARSVGGALQRLVLDPTDTNHRPTADASAAAALSAVRRRLEEAHRRRHTLLPLEPDAASARRRTRAEVRAAVSAGLQRYRATLRALDGATHLQLPFAAPAHSPTPHSLGGVVAALRARRHDGDTATAAGRLAGSVRDILTRAGLRPAAADDAASSAVVRFASDGEAAAAANPSLPLSEGSEIVADISPHRRPHGDVGVAPAEAADGEEGRAGRPSRGYVAKLKAMLAYETNRRRRFNQIKSKTYRRILRKEKEHEAARRERAFALLHPEAAATRRDAAQQRARAQERVTLRHKNTRAWVRQARRFAAHDEDTRDALQARRARHQQLMNKPAAESASGVAAEEEEDERRSESAASEVEDRVVDELLAAEEGGGGPLLASSAETLAVHAALWGRGGGAAAAGEEAEEEALLDGPFAAARRDLTQMRFMTDARARERAEYAAQMQSLREDVRRVRDGRSVTRPTESDAETETGESGSSGLLRGARRVFARGGGPEGATAAATVPLRLPPPRRGMVAATHTETAETVEQRRVCGVAGATGEEEEQEEEEQEEQEEEDGGSCGVEGFAGDRRPRAAEEDAQGNSTEAEGRDATHAGRISCVNRHATSVSRRLLRAPVEATPVDSTVFSHAAADVTTTAKNGGGGGGGSSSDVDATTGASPFSSTSVARSYWVARAFANDAVDADFAAAKAAEVETIMTPSDANGALPGWGEWGGSDARLNQRHRAKLAHRAAQRAVERSFLLRSRADAALSHVMINHDGVELVPDRMTLHMVPRPFANAQEFARSLRQPSGPEWTSALAYKAMTQPRVEVRQGQAVTPLDLSLRRRRRRTTRRKVGVETRGG